MDTFQAPPVTPRDGSALTLQMLQLVFDHRPQGVFWKDRDLVHYEEPQTRPDGSTSWLRASKIPVRDGDGQIVGLPGMYEDITDRKRAAHGLRRGAARPPSITVTSAGHFGLDLRPPAARPAALSNWQRRQPY
jgi:hypothetical protein